MYVLLVGALYLVIAWRYGKPFWRSLGWTLRVPRRDGGAGRRAACWPSRCPCWAWLLRAPAVRIRVEELITGRASLAP